MSRKIIIVGDWGYGAMIGKLAAEESQVIMTSADGINQDGEMIELKTSTSLIRNVPMYSAKVKLVSPEIRSVNPYARSGNKIFLKKK